MYACAMHMFLILIHVTMMHIPILHLSMTLDPDTCMYDAFINLIIDSDACVYDAHIYGTGPWF